MMAVVGETYLHDCKQYCSDAALKRAVIYHPTLSSVALSLCALTTRYLCELRTSRMKKAATAAGS